MVFLKKIMKNDNIAIKGNFYTPLGQYKLFGSLSYTMESHITEFNNHLKTKFDIIELKPQGKRHGQYGIYAFTKDCDGNTLSVPQDYTKHLKNSSTEGYTDSESQEIWKEIKPKIVELNNDFENRMNKFKNSINKDNYEPMLTYLLTPNYYNKQHFLIHLIYLYWMK
ncbi:MAG: hypothetical protein IRF12RH_04320 [Rickettsia helvetica]|uniref:Uncharacterized protein n=2 Tax=Rickettsia helvetica TaxID=35789 RepID=A0ABP0T4M1_RICHE